MRVIREVLPRPAYEETRFGFKWGSLEVQRLYSDPRGGTYIEVSSGAERVTIRVTPAGRKLQVGPVKAKGEY